MEADDFGTYKRPLQRLFRKENDYPKTINGATQCTPIYAGGRQDGI